MPAYDRFWDVHLTTGNGWYEFAADIEHQKARAKEKMNQEALLLISPNASFLGPATLMPAPLKTLPERGYIASVVPIPDVASKKKDDDIKRLLEWVNHSEYKGKLRFNAHGLEGGKVYMGSAEIWADQLVSWLVENKLNSVGDAKERAAKRETGQLKGLLTICLAICLGGAQSTPKPTQAPKEGVQEEGVQVAASMSAVDLVVSKLRRKELFHIQVTGCADPVRARPSDEQLRQQVLAKHPFPSTDSVAKMSELQLRAAAKQELEHLPDTIVQQLNTLTYMEAFTIDNMPESFLQDLFKEMRWRKEEHYYAPLKAKYPDNIKPGQLGLLVNGPGGTKKFVRLAKHDEKISKYS